MKSTICFLLFYHAITGGTAFPYWDSLRVTWCYNPNLDPEFCFQSVPRTTDDAIAAGWRELNDGGCHNHGKFNGRRFVKGDNLALSPLYDNHGIIAGAQMNLLKDELFAIPNPYKYDEVGDYLDNKIDGRPAFSMTFYYVNPDDICHDGRTKSELIRDGTGTGLYIQVGPSPTRRNILKVPLYRDVAILQGWSDNLCVPTMGYHNYYRVDKMSDSNCDKMRPSFLIYNNLGELHGYGATGVGNMSSPSFEHPNEMAVKTGLGLNAPDCMIEHSYYPRYSNMHMFLVDNPWTITCEKLVQAVHPLDVYTNPTGKVDSIEEDEVVSKVISQQALPIKS